MATRYTTPGSIDLRLEGFCIETTARQVLRDLTVRLLEGDDTTERELSGAVELLQNFLETSEFKGLRAERQALDGNWDVTVRLRQVDGQFEIDLLDEPRRHDD